MSVNQLYIIIIIVSVIVILAVISVISSRRRKKQDDEMNNFANYVSNDMPPKQSAAPSPITINVSEQQKEEPHYKFSIETGEEIKQEDATFEILSVTSDDKNISAKKMMDSLSNLSITDEQKILIMEKMKEKIQENKMSNVFEISEKKIQAILNSDMSEEKKQKLIEFIKRSSGK